MRKQTDKLSQSDDSELQQIQRVISELISSNVLLQKLTQKFDELYKKCLSFKAITNHYEETLESDIFIERETDTSKQIIAEHKALS